MRNRSFHLLGACTVAAITAAFALACADQPTAVLDDRMTPGDADFAVTGTPNAQDWRQCRNNNDRDSECAWITGNLNATHNVYFEGDMVPKVLRIPHIVGTDPFQVVMTYGVSKGGKTTHDFLGKWNLDIVNANPCQGAGGGGGRYAAFCDGPALGDLHAITATSNAMDALSMTALNTACASSNLAAAQAAMTQAIGAVGAGNLVVEAIGFNSVVVQNITWSGCPLAGGDVEATLTMTVTPSGAYGSEGLLLFGAHVARGFDWPNGGAGDVSGSPYHLGLVSVDGRSAGSMDLQMAAAAIVIPGSITVEKVCVGSTEGTFDYTGTVPGGGALAPFDLDCGDSQQVVEGTDFGQYTITEDVPTGWELTDIECTAGSTSLATATATVNLAEGQHVHCTFENTRQGSITIVKETIGGDGTFAYTAGGSPLANFNITTVANTGSEVFDNVPAGTYTVTEQGPSAGWEFVDLVCVGNGPGGSIVAQTANIDLVAGGNVTCTYRNRQQGTITIVKNTIGADGTFAYTAGGAPLANFDITTVANSGSEVFNNVSAGSYTVTEQGPPAGWTFVSLTCVGNGAGGSVVGQTASIDLVAGGSVTCTFTNELIPEAEDETAFAFGGALATCFIPDFSNWGWTNGLVGDGDSFTWPLYAGAAGCDLTKGTHVGNVLIDYAGGVLDVSINLFATYTLLEQHVYAGATPYPLDSKGNPTVAPGQYHIADPLTGDIHVIVHAVVGMP